MSKKIFNRAKLFADKVLKIYINHGHMVETKKIGISNHYYNKRQYLIDAESICNKDCMYETYIINLHFGNRNINNKHYYIIRNDIDRYLNKSIMKLDEFSSDIDFQLSTLFDERELLEYYIVCILFNNNFNGAVLKGIHHNTLNAIIKIQETQLDIVK